MFDVTITSLTRRCSAAVLPHCLLGQIERYLIVTRRDDNVQSAILLIQFITETPCSDVSPVFIELVHYTSSVKALLILYYLGNNPPHSHAPNPLNTSKPVSEQYSHIIKHAHLCFNPVIDIADL